MFEIKTMFPDANIPRTIRFAGPLFEELNQVATDNRVSFNKLVLMCCQYALDNMKPAEGEDAE